MPLFIIIIIITDWIGWNEFLLPINHENYNFTEQNRTVSKLGKKGKISIFFFQDIVIFQWKKFSILKKAPIKESVHCFYGDWN